MTTANWALSARSGMPPSPVTTAGSANWPTRRSQPKGTTTSGVAKAKAKADKEAEKIDALIAEGWDPDEAESEVTGEPIEAIRKRNFMLQEQADDSRTFDQMVTSKYRDLAYEQYRQAEDATNGYMFSREGARLNERAKQTNAARAQARAALSPPKEGGKPLPPLRLEPTFEDSQDFWDMTEQQVRNYASEELRGWFDEHGRYTRDGVKRAILEGRSIKPDATHQDYLR